jgi:hypothetical protein
MVKSKAVPLHAMEALGGRGEKLLLIHDLGSRQGVVSVTPRPRFTYEERTPGTHCTGGWVEVRAGLDTEARGKILSPLPGIEPRSPGRPDRSQTLYWLSYLAHCNNYFIFIICNGKILLELNGVLRGNIIKTLLKCLSARTKTKWSNLNAINVLRFV